MRGGRPPVGVMGVKLGSKMANVFGSASIAGDDARAVTRVTLTATRRSLFLCLFPVNFSSVFVLPSRSVTVCDGEVTRK